jgi:hypothetical protein
MVEAGYMAIYDDKEVNFYDTGTTKIMVLGGSILKGWQCPWAKLWCVPLVDNTMKIRTPPSLIICTSFELN